MHFFCQKKVSSTVGHNLMIDHPFAERRFEQAHENISELKDILKSGDLDKFTQLVESEALTLHAMLMTSKDFKRFRNLFSTSSNMSVIRASSCVFKCFQPLGRIQDPDASQFHYFETISIAIALALQERRPSDAPCNFESDFERFQLL